MLMNWYGRRLIHWNTEELNLERGRVPYPLDHTRLHSMLMCFGHAYIGEPHLECGRRMCLSWIRWHEQFVLVSVCTPSGIRVLCPWREVVSLVCFVGIIRFWGMGYNFSDGYSAAFISV